MDLVQTLDGYFGGWSFTFTTLSPPEALRAAEAVSVHPVENPLDALREEEDEGIAEDGVLLVAGRVHPSWSVIVETSGHTGFVGAERSVLLELCGDGFPAMTVFKNPNRLELLYADLDDRWGGMALDSGIRWGEMSPPVSAALTAAGFLPDGQGVSTEIPGRAYDDLARRAVTAATGVSLEDVGTAGGWVSGIVPAKTAAAQVSRSRSLR
ncbi:hypothetical protein ACLIYP_09795 [Streptomyces nanhaiensis]|uniref:hypothetical protein n=1 Tax=Streptomyces nanhaiensis TaxID=679319 RepID=UPI00399C9F2D